jgi:ectoine hydroxylase-related dioxygenase (phytanoyl-CoA dioxygenase family)
VLWDHPISYTDRPQQYFLMYYLVDTSRHNGCLRVIPGSHLKRHPLHDLPRNAHESDEVGTAANLEHPALQPAAGEVDVPVRAGDVVVGDARLLHSAQANRSDQRRTVLTIWYWPAYDELPEEVQALITRHVTERPDWCRWVEQTRAVTGDLLPDYDGAVEQASWNNVAGAGLK